MGFIIVLAAPVFFWPLHSKGGGVGACHDKGRHRHKPTAGMTRSTASVWA
jgi:hypothetical protein